VEITAVIVTDKELQNQVAPLQTSIWRPGPCSTSIFEHSTSLQQTLTLTSITATSCVSKLSAASTVAAGSPVETLRHIKIASAIRDALINPS